MNFAAKLPGRVLVIDDERSARLLLERVLTRAGHDVTLVESGEEALTHLARRHVDVLVTDKNLLGMSGLQVLRLARAQYPRLQAVMVTGFPSGPTRAEAEALGVFAYVTKPFGILDIVSTLDGAMAAAQGAQRPEQAH